MSAMAIGGIVFAVVFGGALLGIAVRAALPDHHLSADTKDIVKLATGLIATMTALVLGLLISSAKGSYDTRGGEITQMAANIILLDQLLAHYGPETRDARDLLRRSVIHAIGRIWPRSGSGPSAPEPAGEAEAFFDMVQNLTPHTESQRSIQAQALSITQSVVHMTRLLAAQSGGSIPMPFLVLVVGWLALIFASFAMFAPNNGTVIFALLVCAACVSSAVYLILELDQPFGGLIQISSAPMHELLAHLGR